MPTARTQPSVFSKTVAKDYLKLVQEIREVLKQKRKEYKEAVAKEKKAKTEEALAELKEKKANAFDEFEAEKLTWPYYKRYQFSRSQNRVISDGLDRAPYSPQADPFPGESAIVNLSMLERARIVDTALLARRGVKDKKRFLEGLIPRITSSDGIKEFKHYISKYINPKPYSSPPAYPRGSSEYDEEEGDEYEEWQNPDIVQHTPPANPFANIRGPTYRRRTDRTHVVTPEGSPGLVTQGAPPHYSSPDYPLEQGGKKTRKHRKHKRSNKHSKSRKHKRSKRKQIK